MTSLEGPITRIVYHEPAGHSALELLRNYEAALSEAGFKQMGELAPNTGWDNIQKAWQQGWQTGNQLYYWSSVQQQAYVFAQANRDGKLVSVAVTVGDFKGPVDFTFPTAKNATHFDNGQLAVVVDVITGKAMANSMVLVKADDMAKAIKETGKIDVYGITFDVDKTDIRPESAATLEQVMQLLKNDPELKLEVAGHTDNTGDKAHNQTLSEGRANAVVQALVTKYGIDASRLQAKGYGQDKPVASNDTEDGRAKNRRVELKKV
jgi:outer membrane protein OmpA-like peptidoglycan-associated protein